MSNIRDPQFGVKKDKDTLTTQDPAAVLYGVTSDNKWIPIKISDDGALAIGASVTLEAGDLEIGAVEIKNYDTDDRAYVSPNHEVLAQARLYDAAGNALTSTSGSLDVDISNATLAVTQSGAWTTGRTWTLAFGTDSVSAVQSGLWNINNITGTVSLPTGASTEATLLAVKTDLDKFTFTGSDLNVRINSGTLAVTLDHTTSNILVYGNDGTNDQKLKTNTSGELQVGITNATLAVTQSGAWSVGRTWTLASGTDSVSAVQSGLWNINNITGTVSLPTGAATEVTLAGIKTQTDKLTFSSTRLLVDGSGVVQPVSGTVNVGNFPATQNVNVTNATLAVTQSGAWTVTSNIGTTGGLALDATLTGGTAKTRILDSAGTALTSSLVNTRQALDVHQADTSFIVSGLTAVGSIPSLNPVSVSGVDGGGLKRHILTDTSGKVQVNLNDNAGSPITLGQKTSANSVPVVIASDQSAVPISTPGTMSVGNSTTTPLGANAVFTGIFENVNAYAFLAFTVFSDQASATNGLSFQWSSDGVNVDRTESSSVLASTGRAFALEVRAAYFRIIYTNGSVAQTTFRVRTDYHTSGTGLITKPVKGSVTDDNFAQLTQSTLLVHNSDGSFSQVENYQNLGKNYLSVAEIQNVRVAPNNQSTTNLAAGATFTGTSDSTLGVNAIRINIIADQPLTVLVQQSTDGTNWDVQDRYTLAAGVGDGRVVQAVASYVRVLVTNTGASTTTYFRLQTTLCPESDPEPRMPMENIQGTISANGGTVYLNNNGYANIGVQVTGTWSGTLQFEVSSDSAFTSIYGIAVPNGVTQTSTTANGLWIIPSAGFSQLRIRASSWSSGTATITLIGHETASYSNAITTGPIPNGAVGNPNPVVVGGRDDTGAIRSIATDDLIGGKQFLYTTAIPIQADSSLDNTYYSTILEFILPAGNTETPFLLVSNPTGSAKRLYIDDLQMDIVTKGQQAICRLYHTPTITANGTAISITNCHIGAGAPASSMQAFSGPTILVNGTKLRVFSVGTNSNSTVVPVNYSLILEPNTSILITGTPTANNVTVAFSIRWTEDI